jgi:hypothetical protein
VDLDYDQDDIERTQVIAYADDLVAVTGGPRVAYMQQLQAKWLSAFCPFPGMVMHPAKVVSTIIGPTLREYQQKSIIDPLNFKDKFDIIVHDYSEI